MSLLQSHPPMFLGNPTEPALPAEPSNSESAVFESDHRFHFAPSSVELLENTISPIYQRLQHSRFGDVEEAKVNYNDSSGRMPPGFMRSTSGSYLGYIVPSPRSSTEAYLLLEAAQSGRAISHMRKDLAYEIIHRNSITLQLNQLLLENAQNDVHDADELIGHVRLSIRQYGYSAAHEHATREVYSSHHRSSGKFSLL
ncbi:hypothetical protein OG21DRAFT_1491870 [Imleria badia]|nr:hypothetical protein OG21DRAFT_1491870 [Imleria badia]